MEKIIKQLKEITGIDFEILKGVKRLPENRNHNTALVTDKGQIIGINTNLENIEFLKYFNSLEILSLFNSRLGIEVLKDFKNLRELYISNSEIYNLDFISQCENLITLIVRRCKLNDISAIQNLTKLIQVDLWTNEIAKIDSIENLTNLVKLTLWDNKISDITALKSLVNLNYLDIDDNEVVDISVLAKLTKLETLYIAGNSIKTVKPISNLPNLKTLFIYTNPIVDIEHLNNITKLEVLNIGNCNIKNLKVINNLTSLQTLIADTNNIADISDIASFKNLTNLNISSNLIDDLNPISSLTNLIDLNCSKNLITDTSPLANLFKLRKINLIGNNIKDIRPLLLLIESGISIGSDEHDEGLFLDKNPLEYPSFQTLKQGNSAILRFFKKIDAEGEGTIYEAKLTFVGEGSAGKTSLMKRLIDSKASFPQEKNRTRGISIEDWVFKKQKNKKHIAHIWDFGGQDVYYPVHRFFLTENSVFVLLASSRQNTHHFDYWIPTIYQFGGKSPIIIGQTCHDGNVVHWNDIGDYFASDNFNIIKDHSKFYHELNLPKGNKGLPQIKRSIISQITNLPHYKKNVPKSWLDVRELLNSIKQANCISYIDLKERIISANSESFKSKEDVEDCISFFHSIGVVLWYQNESQLQNWVILDPKWAVDAVYKIIDFKKNINKGIILADDFNSVWKSKIYDNKHNILKDMLEVFKIAFPKKSNKGDYIMPTRLDSIDTHFIWSSSDSDLNIEYHYDFMPKGLVNQISAELSKFVRDNEIWNNAVNLYDTNAKGQVFEDFFKRKIVISTHGEDSRGLMLIIMNAIRDVTDGYKGVKPNIIIPCPCEKCLKRNKPTVFQYDMLLEKLKEVAEAKVSCNISDERFSIETLLFNIGITPVKKALSHKIKQQVVMRKTFRIFLASSSELLEERKAFREFISVENDRLHQQGIYLQIMQWEHFLDEMSKTRLQDEYNNTLKNCDIAVFLFFSKVGTFTEEEFDVAYSTFSATGNPRIWTYFKDSNLKSGDIDKSITTLLEFKERLKELGHYSTNFNSDSDLHLKFKRQIEYILDDAELD